ncbi:MAG: hypothetical protein IJG24_07210, partial [Selenomonadaceae bacterium]|nr:hypothetical protein [Selenomonadaceae bacterium]
MNKFIFDLQRFADDVVEVSTADAFSTAINNTANAGKTIKLTGDISLTAAANITQNITIDLNGNHIGTTAADTFCVSGSSVTLTVKDSSTEAKGYISGGTDDAVYLSNSGNLILESGTIKRTTTTTSGYAPICGKTGTFTMNGGSVVIESGSSYAVQVGNFTMNDGTIDIGSTGAGSIQSGGTATIKKGTFKDDVSQYVASTAKYYFYDDVLYVGDTDKPEVTQYSLAIDGTTKYYSTQEKLTTATNSIVAKDASGNSYSSLQLAVDKVADNGTITLQSDVTLSGFVAVAGKKVTIDLKDHNITKDGNFAFVVRTADGTQGDLTIQDTGTDATKGTVTATKSTVLVGDGDSSPGKFTLLSGTLSASTASYESDGKTYDTKVVIVNSGSTFTMGEENGTATPQISTSGRGVDVYSNATFTMNNGSIGTESSTTENGVGVWGEDATFIMNGGSIYSDDSFGVFNNGTNAEGYWKTKITINGGTISSTKAAGIYNPAVGSTLTINGGTISGGESGIEVRAGTLNITGDNETKISSTATTYTYSSNGNGSTTTGAGIAIAQHTTQDAITVNIGDGKDGTEKSDNDNIQISGAVALSVANPQGNNGDAPVPVVNINGGTFEGKLGYSISTEKTAPENSGESGESGGNAGSTSTTSNVSDTRVKVNITGGVFKGDLANNAGTSSTSGNVTTTTFSSSGGTAATGAGYELNGTSITFTDVKYVPKGYKYKKSDSGYTVDFGEAVAKIGEQTYNSLADAIAAVADNTETTITLLGEIDDDTDSAIAAGTDGFEIS